MNTDLTLPDTDHDAADVIVEHDAPPAAARRQATLRRWAPVWHPAAIFAASRAATLAAAAVAADLNPQFGLGGVLTHSWDAGWYLAVAQHGYPGSVPEQAGRAVQFDKQDHPQPAGSASAERFVLPSGPPRRSWP